MKRQKTDAPEDLSSQDKNWLLDQCRRRSYLRRYGNKRSIQHLVDRCLAHHGSKGTQFADWKRACWNWILKEYEFRAQRRRLELPQEPRRATQRELYFHDLKSPKPVPLGKSLQELLLEPFRENQPAGTPQREDEQNRISMEPGARSTQKH